MAQFEKFTDWYLKQMCKHQPTHTGLSPFILYLTPSRKKAVVCQRCQLHVDIPDSVWERWQEETGQKVTQ